jgi:prophage regulatory protein
MPTVDPIVYRLPALRQAVQLSTTTIYDLINKGDFPRPVQLTGRAVGWPAHEVRAWLDSRPRAGVVDMLENSDS